MLKELRSVKSTPIIIISTKLEMYNRIEHFKIGADDYITKPFDIDEVMTSLNCRSSIQRAASLFWKVSM